MIRDFWKKITYRAKPCDNCGSKVNTTQRREGGWRCRELLGCRLRQLKQEDQTYFREHG